MKQVEIEQIPILRGEKIISSLAGAFGSSLKETRLTALLGYLIALNPTAFSPLFGFKGTPLDVTLESSFERDRADILVKTTKGNGIIEAKINSIDPLKQSMKYDARWRVLLTQNVPNESQKKSRNIKYLRWQDVSTVLVRLKNSINPIMKFLSRDLLTYLEEHRMIRTTKESVEIYAREINEKRTLELFLKAHMYGCHYEKGSRLPEAHYFAPHFGQRIAEDYPGTKVGISYIAKIETVEVVEKWQDLIDVVKTVRGNMWLKKHRIFLDPIRKAWDWKGGVGKRYFLFLGAPRLVFNPPIGKEYLQGGKGWLSKRFYSFDSLFEAWGCY